MFRASRCRQRPSTVRAGRHVRWAHSLSTAEAPHLPARLPQLLAGQPIVAATLVQVGLLTKTCKLCADTPGSILSDG